MEQFHTGQNAAVEQGKHFTKYAFAFQFVFPIIVIFFLGWLSIHLVENDTKGFFRKFREQVRSASDETTAGDQVQSTSGGTAASDNEDDEKVHQIGNISVSTRNMHILMLIICSVAFVVYVLVLDSIALSYRHEKVTEKIFFIPEKRKDVNYGEAMEFFNLQYGVPILMLCYDLVIFAGITAFLVYRRCGMIALKWYHVIVAPMACIVVHSYHILVAFIQTPEHATSILIFYAILVLVFYITLKAAYHNLFQCYFSVCWKRNTSNSSRWMRCWTLECCATRLQRPQESGFECPSCECLCQTCKCYYPSFCACVRTVVARVGFGFQFGWQVVVLSICCRCCYKSASPKEAQNNGGGQC